MSEMTKDTSKEVIEGTPNTEETKVVMKGNSRDAWLTDLAEKISEENTKLYIKERVMSEMSYYSKVSRDCKEKYIKWMKWSIFLGALIPVASVIASKYVWVTVITAALGSAVTAITAYLNLTEYKELWVSSRTAREQTYSTLMMYFTDTGLFNGRTEEEKNQLLVIQCEGIFNEEHKYWGDLVKKEENQNVK